ncbi:S24/S26 family peptidase [Ferrimicrobium sp.]|uniref:S24/S26 family peptidase n=1 Tax=Ferrimicrobium sp. TaxID=2926050 RepID=UPI002615D9CC|nr:S24/S26 family peptidase [Ferrimicrobium sp.]
MDLTQASTPAGAEDMPASQSSSNAPDGSRSAMTRVAKALGIAILAALIAGGALLLSFTNHSYVYTPSMWPTIPPGSMIFVEHEPSYHVGEVIEFHANGLIWAHQLIAIKPNGDLVTKGENPASRPDVFVPPLRMKDVIGKVVYAPKFLGFPQLFIHHPAYAWRWFVFELGIVGKVILGLAVGALVWFTFTRTTKHKTPSPAAASEPSHPEEEEEEEE